MSTKQGLFKKYGINESHATWENIDSWMAVELFRLMNDRLPNDADNDFIYAMEFLYRVKSDEIFFRKFFSNVHFGSLYLTAKKIIYRFSDDILKNESECS